MLNLAGRGYLSASEPRPGALLMQLPGFLPAHPSRSSARRQRQPAQNLAAICILRAFRCSVAVTSWSIGVRDRPGTAIRLFAP